MVLKPVKTNKFCTKSVQKADQYRFKSLKILKNEIQRFESEKNVIRFFGDEVVKYQTKKITQNQYQK